MRILFGLILMLTGSLALAQGTVEGLWKTIDDETGEAKSHVRIEQRDDMFYGTVEEVLNPEKKNSVCDKCPGDRLGVPIEGLEIIRDMKAKGDGWAGGTILDPKKGKVYKAKMSLNDSADELTVRGFIGFSLIGRSQTWQRVE